MAPELLAARASRRTNEFALLERAANYNVDIQNYIRELKRNPGDRSMMKEAKFLAEGALPPEELLQQREAAQRNTLQWSAADVYSAAIVIWKVRAAPESSMCCRVLIYSDVSSRETYRSSLVVTFEGAQCAIQCASSHLCPTRMQLFHEDGEPEAFEHKKDPTALILKGVRPTTKVTEVNPEALKTLWNRGFEGLLKSAWHKEPTCRLDAAALLHEVRFRLS